MWLSIQSMTGENKLIVVSSIVCRLLYYYNYSLETLLICHLHRLTLNTISPHFLRMTNECKDLVTTLFH